MNQGSLTKDQWNKVEEVTACAKVKAVHVEFGNKLHDKLRAVQAFEDGLAKNKFVTSKVLL